jgi:5-hydroxyisourate hydrolase
MGKLTTHVLDTAHGRPGAGIRIQLSTFDGTAWRPLREALTDADGRCADALLEGTALLAGEYELLFHAGDYFSTLGVILPEPRFVDRVALRFGIADPAAHYHVPLLVSPWSYSTYRGS